VIGRTLCVNPGSEYTEGVLRGAVLRIAPDRILDMQFVRG
jgi:Icc-related predicted phosphoesterase